MREDLKLPAELLDGENIKKLLIILFPCQVKSKENIEMKDTVLFKIFKENNRNFRSEFFQEPLIKYLRKNIFVKDHSPLLI